MLVSPSGEQSGIEVLNNPKGSGIVFVSHLRRRTAAFIYETAKQEPGGALQKVTPKPITIAMSSTLASLGTLFGLNPPNTPFPALEVQPANGLHGIVGSLSDVISEQGAFMAISSAPFDLPQDGDAIKTVHTIVVVGPAFQVGNSLSGFPLA